MDNLKLDELNRFSYKPQHEIFSELYKILIILGVIGVISFISSFLYYSLLNISSSRQAIKIRYLIFKSLLKQEISWHEKNSPGELSSRIINDSIIIEEGIGIKLGILCEHICKFLVCFVVAFINGWKLSLMVVIILPILALIIFTMVKILGKCITNMQRSYATIGGIAQEAFSQIRTIVSFGTEQKEIDRYVKNLEPTKKYGMIKSQTVGICIGAVFGVISLSYTISFIKGSQLVNSGEMQGGDVLKVFMGILTGAMSITGLANIFTQVGQTAGAASLLYSIIDRKPAIDGEKGIKENKSISGLIEFRNVQFSYPSRPNIQILKGINFKCYPGQTVAIVGSSGSGKSTIVQLIERFYERNDGQILIDNRNIEDYDLQWLRHQIGLVSQEPILFDASIAENISIGFPDATEEQIEMAAKMANAHEFIMNLPNGYKTSTGERGLQLSGGQKQRICIARALITNPKILLLDEATSALDNQSEKAVQSALDSAAAGRTTVVIAHRLSTIKNANSIIVMKEGTIAEIGNHSELMNKKGIYYDLVKNQNLSNDNNEQNTNSIGNKISNNNSNNNSTNKIENRSIDKSKNSNENKNKIKSSNISSMDWKRYLEYNSTFWWANLLGAIGSILNGSTQPLLAYILASAMNVFNKHGQDLLDSGRFWGYMFILLGLFNFISYYLQHTYFSVAGEQLSYLFRKEMYNSMIRQEVGFFESNNINSGMKGKNKGNNNQKLTSPSSSRRSTGWLTAKLTIEANSVQGLNTSIGSLLEIIITIIVALIIAFLNSWKLSLILVTMIPFLFIGTILQSNANKNKYEVRRNILQNSTNIVVESLTNIKTVYALNLQDHFFNTYREKLLEPEAGLEKKYYISSLGIGFSNAITFVVYILGFYFGAIFMKNDQIQFVNLFRVLMAIIYSTTAVGRTSSAAPDYDKSAMAFMNILKIIDRQSKIDANDPKGIKLNKGLKGDISFNHIQFAYPSRPNNVVLQLGNDKIYLPSGKKLAIVGGSGSGKSTLIALLLRWYDAQSGEIKIDEQKNTNYNIKWLREQMGIVNQEPCLFNISIKENILYGKENATDEEVMEAAKKANIHDFIMSLPEGYNTLVGRVGTTQMSGGQKQRIAIARAIIRNPKILLLDEATSALDTESELIIKNALEEVSDGRTTITIAHRLSTIRNADIIIVMKDGKIVEKGNHEELMIKKGEYYEMVLSGESNIPNSLSE
ncbi:hypothetical protein PIROE2DRAFT_41336 [Piromyces sp. E2]|nr:hypothetical protein PIROE2DRAFT_41336 [Piromyces sp. E2]|eukprot:OUM65780.1 hypothetical protein PIROE2DRAFT_41336 [Piromyces sp. E2]